MRNFARQSIDLIYLGLIAAVVGMFICSTSPGSELKLFETADQPLAFFAVDEPVLALFEAPCEFFQIEQPETFAAQAEPVFLFDPILSERKIEHAIHLVEGKVGTGAGRLISPEIKKQESEQKATKPDTRPYVIGYAPDTDVLSNYLAKRIGTGDERLRVHFVIKPVKELPAFAVAHAADHDWPVWHWNSPSGKGALWHDLQTMDELVDLVKIEPGKK